MLVVRVGRQPLISAFSFSVQSCKLIVPESFRPFLDEGEKTIQHDKLIFAHALRPDLQIGELDDDPRVQIHRTSMDSFLSG
jgi:hypothetical protein